MSSRFESKQVNETRFYFGFISRNYYVFSLALLAALIAFPISSFAKDGEKLGPVEIEFKTMTNLKVGNIERIRIDGNKITFNSNPVDVVGLPGLVSPLQVLSHVKGLPEQNCFAGTYTHTVTRGKTKKSVTGCLNTPRAAELDMALSRFRK